MPNSENPNVGNWYYDMGSGERFAVIQSDDDSVQIQLADGDLAAISLQEWRGRDLKPDRAPLDWSLPMDSVSARQADQSAPDVSAQADNFDRDDV